VDGIIVSTAGDSANYNELAKKYSVPVVFLNRNPNINSSCIVVTNNFNGSYEATNHLINHKYNNIAIIAGPQNVSTGRDRLMGFERAIMDSGITLDHNLVKIGNFDVESGYNMMKELMEGNIRPNAVFISNNLMTLGAYNYLKEVGLKIPTDVAIIGFDDPEWAKTVDPPLTCVRQPAYDQGVYAAKMILERIMSGSKEFVRGITLDTEFVIRESCGCKDYNR
jgi:LacI family transcriptional regulator